VGSSNRENALLAGDSLGAFTSSDKSPKTSNARCCQYWVEVEYAAGWTHITKVNGIASANIAKVNGIAVANIAKVNGIAV